MKCRIEVCERQAVYKATQLCRGHYTRMRKGQEMNTPLAGQGGANKKYHANTVCEVEGCEGIPHANNKCSAHDWQFKKYGYTWPVGENRKQAASGYTDTKTCTFCGETKNWRKFVLGVDANKHDECRDCYRNRLLQAPEAPVGARRNKNAMAVLMDFLDAVTGR